MYTNILMHFSIILQKAYSDRINGVHFLNMPSFGNTLVTLMNSILSPKLANRVSSICLFKILIH